MKTSELNHNALSFLIARIEMPNLVWGETIVIHHASHQVVVPELPEPDCYSPFTTWATFGPIIEREKIKLEPVLPTGYSSDTWFALIFGGGSSTGPTPLIATMRCYVASKLGDKVKIPEELK